MDDLILQSEAEVLAEQSLLGSILVDAACMAEVKHFAKENFALEKNIPVAAAIEELHKAGTTIDPATVLDQMRESGEDTTGYTEYFRQLMEITPTAANAAYHDRLVRKHALLRNEAEIKAQKLPRKQREKLLSEIRIQLDELENGSRWEKFLARPASEIKPEAVPKARIFIDGILTEGVYMLSGFSKVGKSRLMLQMLLALSTGEDFLRHKTNRCGVLYLALEDEYIDYQNRMVKMLRGEKAPSNFLALTREDFTREGMTTPKLDTGLEDLIEIQLKNNPDIGVIGIDVFSIIRSKSTRNPIEDDSRDITKLIAIASRHKLAIVVAHHVSKTDMRSSSKRSGAIGSGAGTYSLSGTVHGEFELANDLENKGQKIFRVGGRRIKESSFSLSDNYPGFGFIGDYEDIAAQTHAEEAAKHEAALIETVRYIFDNMLEDVTDRRSGKVTRKWTGHATRIKEINQATPNLPKLTRKVTGSDLTESLLFELSIYGITIKANANGNSPGGYTISEISPPTQLNMN